MTTCAICGWRNAMTTTAWGSRDVPACSDCAEPAVAAPPEPRKLNGKQRYFREDIARVVARFDGVEIRDIAEVMGVPYDSSLEGGGMDYRAISRIVCRMASDGELVATRTSPRVYTVPKKARRAA